MEDELELDSVDVTLKDKSDDSQTLKDDDSTVDNKDTSKDESSKDDAKDEANIDPVEKIKKLNSENKSLRSRLRTAEGKITETEQAQQSTVDRVSAERVGERRFAERGQGFLKAHGTLEKLTIHIDQRHQSDRRL